MKGYWRKARDDRTSVGNLITWSRWGTSFPLYFKVLALVSFVNHCRKKIQKNFFVMVMTLRCFVYFPASYYVADCTSELWFFVFQGIRFRGLSIPECLITSCPPWGRAITRGPALASSDWKGDHLDFIVIPLMLFLTYGPFLYVFMLSIN